MVFSTRSLFCDLLTCSGTCWLCGKSDHVAAGLTVQQSKCCLVGFGFQDFHETLSSTKVARDRLARFTGPRSGPDCTVGARLHRLGPIGPIAPRSGPGPDCTVRPRSGPDCAVGPRSGRACAVTRRFALESYKAASSATPAVRMVPVCSVRILGGCGAVGDIARAYFLQGSCHLFIPC